MYNSKHTIQSTIDSVINQTYEKIIEIIVVNDGSKDGSEKIVEEIVEEMILNNQTNRIIKLINKENSGVSTARNKGVKEAVGEYIAFLDSDDKWHPQKLELVLKTLKENSVKFLGHGYTLENNFNQIFQLKQPVKIPFLKLVLKNFAVTPSIVIKKDISESFNESMSHTEDHDLWLRIALKNDVYFLDLSLVKLGRPVLAKGGLSANRWAMRIGELQMYKNIVSYKKILIPFYPFLVIFSLTKHLRYMIKDFFEKN